MRRIDVQSDGSPIEIRVFDGDRQVARHVLRSAGQAGELVICAGGPGSPTENPAPPKEHEGWLDD